MTRAALTTVLACVLASGPGQWTERLETLDPDDPMAYFELAEEVADASADRPDRELARQLFALAGALDPQRLGRSACLALADLEPEEHAKRRLSALAALLDERAGGPAPEPAATMTEDQRAAALAVTEAIGYYRRGNGARALAALRTPGATELLDAYPAAFRGGADRFVEDCRLSRGSRRPVISEQDLVAMLRFEEALLAGDHRSWSGELLLTAGRPLIEVDPDRLESSFGIDASKPCYRDGRWQPCD